MNPAQLDENQLVRALTDVLHQQCKALAEDGPQGAQAVQPIWQPLIDALDRYAVLRRNQGMGVAPSPSPEMVADVSALRDEAQALQHTLAVWSAALQTALGQSAEQDAGLTYGPGKAALGAGARSSLGRS